MNRDELTNKCAEYTQSTFTKQPKTCLNELFYTRPTFFTPLLMNTFSSSPDPKKFYPGNRTEKEWFENLPQPTGGRVITRVQEGIAVATKEIVKPDFRFEEALMIYRSDYENLPQHLKDLMPWEDVVQRLLQVDPKTGKTQLEMAYGLNRGGVLAGITLYGQPMITDAGITLLGAPYDQIAKSNTENGVYSLERGNTIRFGNRDGMTYEERWAVEMFGRDLLPYVPGAGQNGMPLNHYGCYAYAGKNKLAPYVEDAGIFRTTKTAPRDKSINTVGAFRFLAVRDIKRTEECA